MNHQSRSGLGPFIIAMLITCVVLMLAACNVHAAPVAPVVVRAAADNQQRQDARQEVRQPERL
jgi:hypothetical protein